MSLSGEVRRVADVVLGRIVAGGYPSGLRLPSEVELAAELRCARSTVREALRHLAGLGVLESRRGSGAKVRDFRREGTLALLAPYLASGRIEVPAEVLARELLRLRALLAGEAVRLASLYAGPLALARARALLAAPPSGDPIAESMRELSFFRELVASSGVWPAVWLANAYWGPLEELHQQLAPAIGGPPPDFREVMTELLDRIEARDEAGATARCAAWLARVDRDLMTRLEAVLRSGGST